MEVRRNQLHSGPHFIMSCLESLVAGTVGLRLYVQPKASKSRITGLHDGCLKIAVAAPPDEGKANKAVVKFLAKTFAIPARDIVVKSGLQSRRKLIVLTGVTIREMNALLENILEAVKA